MSGRALGPPLLKSAVAREEPRQLRQEARQLTLNAGLDSLAGISGAKWTADVWIARSGGYPVSMAIVGTSGSGNHFVEFGFFTSHGQIHGLEAGTYLALLSHSGSRGTGAAVCDHYSKLAFSQFPDLPSELKRLAWLSLDSQEGQEYWAAMELMGRYAAANHALIHKHVAANLGAEVLLDLENHHNFAWKEKHLPCRRNLADPHLPANGRQHPRGHNLNGDFTAHNQFLDDSRD